MSLIPKILALLVLAGLVLCSVGCASGSLVDRQVRVAVISKAEYAQLDPVVIEVAVLDLFSYSGKEFKGAQEAQIDGKPLLSTECHDVLGTSRHAVDGANRTWQEAIFPVAAVARAEAIAHIYQRYETHVLFAPFQPSEREIVRWESLPPATTQPSNVWRELRPISAAAPGYSADRKFAVVCLSFPWSMHHGDAVFLLRCRNDKWVVVARDIAFYV